MNLVTETPTPLIIQYNGAFYKKLTTKYQSFRLLPKDRRRKIQNEYMREYRKRQRERLGIKLKRRRQYTAEPLPQ
jgi:hypothetical protein